MARNFVRCTLCGKMFDTYTEKELYFDDKVVYLWFRKFREKGLNTL
jgi:hypothetical protein